MYIFKKLLIIQLAVLTFQVVAYFGSEIIQHNPHNVKIEYDDRVPLKPAWVYVYILWFPLILLYPMFLYTISRDMYVLYILSVLADIVISVAFYIAYPTSFERKKPEKNFFGKSLGIIYFFSYKGYNCAPSMHCSMCFIIVCTALFCPQMDLIIKLAVIVLSALIVLSTQFTKQHTIIDMLSAVPTMALAIFIGYCIIKVYPATEILVNLGLLS